MRIKIVVLAKIAVLIVVLALIHPTSSQSAVYWEDGFEAGNTGFSLAGGMSYTTNPTHAGSQALDQNFCNANLTQCGSYSQRSFPSSTDVYGRFYFRMQSGFQVSPVATKMFNYDTSQGGLKHNFWLEMRYGGTNLAVAASGVPVNGAYDAKSYPSSFSFSADQWYCVETHIKENTPNVANGLIELWVDGAQVLSAPNQMFMQSGVNNTNQTLDFSTLYVQLGFGHLFYDDIAVGNTRIGCSGSQSSDITPPTAPIGLSIR